MTNEIQTVRESLERGLVSARVCPEEGFNELSPCGRYRLEVEGSATAACPDYATIIVAVVRNAATDAVVATVKRNDSRCFYGWITRDGHDYLLFPEDLGGGQSVVDLTTGRIEGFSSRDDAFIWTQFYPSPDKTMLAVVGCYWACPHQVIVYDFRNPMSLPLPKVGEFVLSANDSRFGEWVSERDFTLLTPDGAARVVEL